MKQQLLHTPEGVRDIYNSECERKLFLEDRLQTTLASYGYHPIQTPSFEFFDVFGKDLRSRASRELFKFFDREGNTLVLRPDITPSIARAAAKYYMEEDLPLRFFYKGNTFINRSSLQGRLKENTQLGAELLGDASVDADAEMLAMIVECLEQSGLKEFQISIGHVELLQGMILAAALDEEEEEELRDLISNNNFFGVEEFIDSRQVDAKLKNLFSMLGKMYQSPREFLFAKDLAGGYPSVLAAISYLEHLQELLELYGIDKYISYEFGVTSTYKYYSGILFRAYTFGSGEPIVKGGRYDKLLSRFGKKSAAIGFAIVIDQLMAALSRQKIEIPAASAVVLLVYTPPYRKQAITYAKDQRSRGKRVELMLKGDDKSRADYEIYAAKNLGMTLQFMDGE